MRNEILSLIETCDELMAAVGELRAAYPEKPVKDWVPFLNRLLDRRASLMKLRDSQPPTEPKNKQDECKK